MTLDPQSWSYFLLAPILLLAYLIAMRALGGILLHLETRKLPPSPKLKHLRLEDL